MNFKLEAIIVPVSDVDRAKKFYQEALGFKVDKVTGRSMCPYAHTMHRNIDLNLIEGK